MIDHAKEETSIHHHNKILDNLTDYCRQLSKKHWATKGDRNTRFFQQACTRRRQKNNNLFIENGPNSIVSKPHDIAHEFIQYFASLFMSSVPMHNLNFSYQGTVTSNYINSVPSIDECLQIVKGMKMNAAPGPDGLNVAFYRAAWPWTTQDVHNLVVDFYNSGEFLEPLNCTEIVHVTDFRPISHTNVAYRIIAKSLANRLKDELPNYIHHSQHAFIQGRRITDNIMIAQEIGHSFNLKSFQQSAFMLKLYLAKAFDRIECVRKMAPS